MPDKTTTATSEATQVVIDISEAKDHELIAQSLYASVLCLLAELEWATHRLSEAEIQSIFGSKW